ncbi:MAG: helix-turn-helix domain-containing protein [Promicromonosporaceae bacterium]|nr:helix-turn-helix domain-containing protein [Promicromonosporaceae bacterium]
MAQERGPDFIEALSRGLDVLSSFSAARPSASLSEVAQATGLARPTARRILLTLSELGYVRASDGVYSLTPRVLDLGTAYVGSLGLWDLARPHMEDLVAQTHESSSMAQLDGSDILYVARVAVHKLIALRVEIGTRFPALRTSQGKVLLAGLPPAAVRAALEVPSRSTVPALPVPPDDELAELLAHVREQGWASADEELAAGVRSVAVPVHDASGRVLATMNVTVHAAETSMDTLLNHHLPLLRRAAEGLEADWARRARLPIEAAPQGSAR